MQIGSRSSPPSANCLILSFAVWRKTTLVGAVDARRDRLDLRLDRSVDRVRELELVRLVGRVDDRLRERRRALAAALERLVQLGGVRAVLEREPADELDLLVRVAGEAVDRDDRPQPEPGDDLEVPREVRGAALDRVEPAVRVAAVVLERLRGRDEHDRARAEPARAADDVEELLHPHVRAEAATR